MFTTLNTKMSDTKITEVSLFFEVDPAPRTHVSKSMPFVARRIGDVIERVVPEGCDDIPEWVTNPRADSMKFVYSCPVQEVECSYGKGFLAFHGIKHKNADQFGDHVANVMQLLNTESSNPPLKKYKATAKTTIRVPWNPDILADVVTNHDTIAQTMAMCEKASTLGNRRLLSVAVGCSRVALTCRGDEVSAMISKLPDKESANVAASAVRTLLDVYEEHYEELSALYPQQYAPTHMRRSSSVPALGINALRRELPELFVNNYTRECPVLPVMIPTEKAMELQHVQRVILYPKEGPNARYYTAPEGHVVGLKRNRLENRHAFPCLVTCYLLDHMERKGSETYRYYRGDSGATALSTDRPLPKPIQLLAAGSNMSRRKASSFLDALESATNLQIADLPWCPQVARQELWDWTDEDIMSAVSADGMGSRVYRYFEELLGVSIHVIVIRDGKFESLIPDHRREYVWGPPYPLHVVIFETFKKTYGKESSSYYFLQSKYGATFDENNAVVSSIITQKARESVPAPKLPRDVTEQIIDRSGKCRTVYTENGSSVHTFCRPLTAAVRPEPLCFLDSHVRKMNAVKREMGLEPTDLSKRSSGDVLYFPNDASFRHYVSFRSRSAAA